MSIEVNEIDFTALKQLIAKRDNLEKIQKENKSYVILNDFEMQAIYFNTKKQRKQVEKQIFKLIKKL